MPALLFCIASSIKLCYNILQFEKVFHGNNFSVDTVHSQWNGTVSGTVNDCHPSQTLYGPVAQLDRATAF